MFHAGILVVGHALLCALLLLPQELFRYFLSSVAFGTSCLPFLLRCASSTFSLLLRIGFFFIGKLSYAAYVGCSRLRFLQYSVSRPILYVISSTSDAFRWKR